MISVGFIVVGLSFDMQELFLVFAVFSICGAVAIDASTPKENLMVRINSDNVENFNATEFYSYMESNYELIDEKADGTLIL